MELRTLDIENALQNFLSCAAEVSQFRVLVRFLNIPY